jgi:DNA repair protein NreA
MKNKKQAYSKPYNIVFEANYPNLIIGPGIYENKEDTLYNNPKDWIGKEIKIIEENRNKQMFTYKNYSKHDVRNKNRDIEEIQNLIKSSKETEIEISLSSKSINLSEKITGVNNKGILLEKIKIVDNIKVEKSIDKITSDSQIKAKDAILELYDKTNEVYKIEQLLSMGLLGLKKNRIFVPTRWSITTIDDTIGKELFLKIKTNKIIDTYKMYKFEFYENKFFIFLLPYSWGFEMIELVNNNIISYDFEINSPKKEYAYQVTGAYYAARLIILNHLKEIGFCARVIVLRDILPKHSSKGVWVIRESIKEALKLPVINFNNLDEIIKYIKEDLKYTSIMQKSEILKQIKFQKRIFDF